MRQVQMRPLALFGLLSLFMGSAPAMGSELAFATGNGSMTPLVGPLELPQASVGESVHIFLDIVGVVPSSPACVTSSLGEEIFGFDVTIEIQGGHQIADFFPAGNVKFSPQTFDSTTTTIHAVGLDALSPGTGAQLIGLLKLDTQSTEGSVIVRGTVVHADLQPEEIEDEIVAAVPEPDSVLMLIAGALTLGVLHSLRLRRDSLSPADTGR